MIPRSEKADLVNWVSSENDTILPYVDDISSSDESFEDDDHHGKIQSPKGPIETTKLKKKKDPHTGSIVVTVAFRN